MIEARIHDGDYLTIDRALQTNNNDIVLAVLNGETTVKRFVQKGIKCYLVGANPKYPPLEVTPDMDFEIWGRVTYIYHPAK